MGPHINMPVKFRKLLKARKGVGTIIAAVMIIVTIIFLTLNTTLWANKTTTTMAESDSDRRLENVTFTNSWINESTSTPTYPSSYSILDGSLVGSVTWPSDVQSIDNKYLTVSSKTVTIPTLYAHREQTEINGTSYYQFKNGTLPDSAVLNLTTPWTQTAGRYGGWAFLYPLANLSLPATTWTFSYYARYWATTSSKWVDPTPHCDVDIIIRRSDGGIRKTIASNVATSGTLSSSGYTLVSGSYTLTSGYAVVDQTDYLEIDYYIHFTVTSNCPFIGSLLIENAGNPTRITGLIPSATPCYLVNTKFDFSGVKADQPVLNITSVYTVGSVTCKFLMYNYATGSWTNLLTYNATANTNQTKIAKITTANRGTYVSGGKASVIVQGTSTSSFNQKVNQIKFVYKGISFTFTNRGPKTTHLIALWVVCPTLINGTSHFIYTTYTYPQFDLLVNVTKPISWPSTDCLRLGWVSGDNFTFRVVTELGSSFSLNTTAP